MLRFLPLSLLFCACSTLEKQGPDTAVEDTAAGPADTDTAADPTDDDLDGHDSLTDCDDHDYTAYPGASEICDGVDNDCDGVVDNGFDLDGDGATDANACASGTDCDDADASIYPEAREVPYDGIDQDCDGADLVDVDGDRYDYTFDCDDEDAAVNPGAEEVAKNGKDDDCADGDDMDGDADGYDDDDLGGDDCDDLDASVHPGARDLWGDGTDTDCDGLDSRLASLADASVTVVGDSGEQGLVGESVLLCDLDEDGADDLVVTAPFAGSYSGRVGIWYGSGEASWTAGMAMSDADTLLESSELFLGFGAQCADIDGDGHLDLVTTRGEIHYSGYDADYEILFFYGDGVAFGATMSEADADARLSYPLGVESGLATVYAQYITTGDLDLDGAAEVLVNDATGDHMTEPTGLLYVLRGKRYAGTSDLVDEAVAEIDGGTDGFSRVRVLEDVDGDGVVDVFIGQASGQAGDTADSAPTSVDTGSSPRQGRAFFADATLVDAAVADLAWRTWEGRAGDAYGWDGVVQDFDGDGDDDSMVVALGYNDYSGALYFFDGLPVDGSPSDATAEVLGSTTAGRFGYVTRTLSDVDGDGINDLFISELLGGSSSEGVVWVISGRLAFAGAGDAESAALLAWSGEEAVAYTGNALGAGDVDADGVQELVVGAQLFSDGTGTTYGKAYLIR